MAGLAVVMLGLTPTTEASATPHVDGDVVRAWNDLAMDTVRSRNASDAQAARLYAMVNVAIYDAANGIAGAGERRDPAMVPALPGTTGDPVVAAAQAAHDVLMGVYPQAQATYDERLQADLAAAESPGQVKHGRAWGAYVAAQVLAARAKDGADGNSPQPGATSVGEFRADWAPAHFRFLEPFAIADPDSYLGQGPPPLDSEAYTAAYDKVRLLGGRVPADQEKLDTFLFWALGSNTNQPPGGWLQVAQSVSESRSLSLQDTARLFALQSLAMVDTVAPTYMTKFVYHSWRPFTAIREGDADPNPATHGDPSWVQRAPGSSLSSIGSSPEYWSGHSTFSAAAATVLAGFFCDDTIAFTLRTDSGGSQQRRYESFSEAAADAGVSRVFGGLHFPFSNEDGLVAGRDIANEVLRESLLSRHGDNPCVTS